MDRVSRTDEMERLHRQGLFGRRRRPAKGPGRFRRCAATTIGMTLAFATTVGANANRRVEVAAGYESGVELVEVRRLEEETIHNADRPSQRAEMERFWLAALAKATGPEAVRLACHQLALCGGEESLPTLAVWLGRGDEPSVVAMALAGIPGGGPAEVMIAALPVLAPRSRLQMLDSLGRRGDVRAAVAVAGWCEHPEETIAVAAIRALGRLGGPSIRSVLEAARKDHRTQVRAEAEAALLDMAQRELAAGRRPHARAILDAVADSGAVHVRRGAFTLLMESDDDHGAARALRLLTASSPDPALAPVALAALPRFDGRGTADRFAAVWTNLPPELQPALADAFARRALVRGDERARQALVRAMWWEPAALREAAILALGRCGGPQHVDPLWQRWFTGGELEGSAAMRALVTLTDDPAVDREIAQRFETAVSTQRVALIDVLARRGGLVRDKLLAATRDADPAVARLAFRAAGTRAEPEDLPHLLDSLHRVHNSEALRSDAETAVARAITRIGVSAGAELRSRWREATESSWKASLVTLMPRAGDPELLKVVVAALHEECEVVRNAALRALASWPGADAWSALMETAEAVREPAARALLFSGLVRIARVPATRAPPVAVRVRELWTACRTSEERMSVLGVAADAPSPETLAVALEALDIPGVRAEARIAVEKIAAAVASTHPDVAAAARRRLDADPP